ncbi:hypothetical protein TWF281_010840 [Arthrobotrys megalospora]
MLRKQIAYMAETAEEVIDQGITREDLESKYFEEGIDMSTSDLVKRPAAGPYGSGPFKRQLLELVEPDVENPVSHANISTTIEDDPSPRGRRTRAEKYNRRNNSMRRTKREEEEPDLIRENYYIWDLKAATIPSRLWDFDKREEMLLDGECVYHRSQGEGAVVYVLDSGFDPSHEDFDLIRDRIASDSYIWPGPYPQKDNLYKRDVNYHGTKVIAKAVGRYGAFASRATLKVVSMNLESTHSALVPSIIDSFVRTYADIVKNHRGKGVVINASFGITIAGTTPKTKDEQRNKRLEWAENAMTHLIRELGNLGDVIITASAGNGAPKKKIDRVPALLSEKAGFQDFVIAVGGVDRSKFENMFQTSPSMKIWAIGDSHSPDGATKDQYEISYGTSYCSPQVAGLLAYFHGMGMTMKQAVRVLYEYAYLRLDLRTFKTGVLPKVIYNGALGINCGEDALDGPRDWDLFFRNRDERLANWHGLNGKRDEPSLASGSACPISSANSSTSTMSEGGLPPPLYGPPANPVNGVVVWSPWAWISAEVLLVLGGVIGLVVQLNGTTTTITTTVTGLEPGETVALSTLIPPSVRALATVTDKPPPMTPPGNVAKTTQQADFPITSSLGTEFPSLTSMTITSMPSLTAPIIITGPGWTSTLNHTMVAPPLSWSTTVGNPAMKFPTTFHRSTVTLTAPGPADSGVNSCNGLRVTGKDAALNETYQYAYQFADRELMARGINQVCVRRPGAGLENTKGSWRQLFYEGSPEAFELDLIWNHKYPTDDECLDNFFRILDGCDNDQKENPWNWKGGGMREITGANGAVYRIDTLYPRKPPSKVWAACYTNKRWFDFETWQDGIEHVIWGFGWLDAVDISQEPMGNVDFRVDLDACQILHFFWKFVSGPLRPDTPWEWRAQVVTKPYEGEDSCVEKVLQKWSKIPDLRCTSGDLEKGVSYLPGGERMYLDGGNHRPEE